METFEPVPAGTRAGLTLIELLVAIVVLGVLGTLLMSRRSAPPDPLTIRLADPWSESAAPPGNLLANGSFEMPRVPPRLPMRTIGPPSMPGWRILRGTVDVVPERYWQPAPGAGRQSLDLVGTPGAATIEQRVPTQRGRDYLFIGWLAHNPQNPVAKFSRADVYLNGQRVTRLVHHDPLATERNMRWRRFAIRFRATGPRTTLRLVDVTGTYRLCGTVLDGLAVIPLPERRSTPN